MKQLSRLSGQILYRLLWLPLWIYLGRSQRVRVVILSGDEILLNRDWLGDRRWALPGGGRKARETANQTAQRELQEELGLHLSSNEFTSLGRYSGRETWPYFRYELLLVRLKQKPTLRLPLTITAASWFRIDELLSLPTKPEVTTASRLLKF